ncbi:MAG: holo-ACP synthase, partial [Elusimicrobiota bacterium]|nr:holo-ACP synthase [Elusimicrobiota bacterium]
MNIGVDIEEVKRFSKFVKDEQYLKKVFSDNEIEYSIPKANPAQHLAARFAAKEAVWKALSAKNKKLLITDISIKNSKDGKPIIYIKGKKSSRIDVSLSHTKNYVVAA